MLITVVLDVKIAGTIQPADKFAANHWKKVMAVNVRGVFCVPSMPSPASGRLEERASSSLLLSMVF